MIGDRAAVVRRLLVAVPDIAKGMATILMKGLVCHAYEIRSVLGRPPDETSIEEALVSHRVANFMETEKKPGENRQLLLHRAALHFGMCERDIEKHLAAVKRAAQLRVPGESRASGTVTAKK